MEIHSLKSFTGGWFVGNFEPSLYKNEQVEVSVKSYTAGSVEKAHYHAIATELTLIVKGEAKFNDITVKAGNIMKILPGEVVKFSAISDVDTVVVKYPSVINDKYITDEN